MSDTKRESTNEGKGGQPDELEGRRMFVLTWNRGHPHTSEEEYKRYVARAAAGREVRLQWTTGVRKYDIRQGDHLVLLTHGDDGGLVAVGHATRDINGVDSWIDVSFRDFVWPQDGIPREDLRVIAPGFFDKFIQASGQQVKSSKEIAAILDTWGELRGQDASGVQGSLVLSDEPVELLEGEAYQVLCNSYRRSRWARKQCIDKFGYECSVCKMRFGERYGQFASEYIQVHHLSPLSHNPSGQARPVSPKDDLRPVCANCHVMLHHKADPPRSIRKLKNLMAKASEASES